MTNEEIKTVLENHKHYINRDCEHWNNMRADLRNADLRYADLRNADLRYADLRYADLRNADLRGADLSNADLYGADLSNADLCGAKNIPFIPMTCPDIGEFIGWKKAQNKIIKLLILDDSKRSSATGRKCRCDKALVLEIQELDGTKSEIISVSSDWDKSFIYTVNKIVEEKEFCTDRFNECSKGIHFFINRQEAVNY